MTTVRELIDELQKRGPIDFAEIGRIEGPVPSTSLVGLALEKISGEEGWNGHQYHCNVVRRCGCHPEAGTPEEQILAYERARQLLVAGPNNRAELDTMLEQNGL